LKHLLISIYTLFRYFQNNSEKKLVDPNICYENVARFKQLLNTLKYDGPVVAMTDNTKLKFGLYSLAILLVSHYNLRKPS